MLIPMIATRDFYFSGVAYVSGQRLSVPAAHAAAFNFQQWARFAKPEDAVPAQVPVVEPKALTAEPPKSRRSRAPKSPQTDTPKRRRTYRRRDLASPDTK